MIETYGAPNFVWAVSQGCSLRRLQLNTPTYLSEEGVNAQEGAVSGGFMADIVATNYVYSGSQQ